MWSVIRILYYNLRNIYQANPGRTFKPFGAFSDKKRVVIENMFSDRVSRTSPFHSAQVSVIELLIFRLAWHHSFAGGSVAFTLLHCNHLGAMLVDVVGHGLLSSTRNTVQWIIACVCWGFNRDTGHVQQQLWGDVHWVYNPSWCKVLEKEPLLNYF